MTNFERWQDTLPENKRVKKPEDLLIDRGDEVDEDEFRHIVKIACDECPCQKECGKNHDYWTGCATIFLDWAKEESA